VDPLPAVKRAWVAGAPEENAASLKPCPCLVVERGTSFFLLSETPDTLPGFFFFGAFLKKRF
jgi:hypothetical protein